MPTIRMMVIADQIAGHEIAINTYTQAISDLILQAKGDPLVDILINQYVAIVRLLIKEWKEMRYEVCDISNRDCDFSLTYGGDRVFPRSAQLQRSARSIPNAQPTL